MMSALDRAVAALEAARLAHARQEWDLEDAFMSQEQSAIDAANEAWNATSAVVHAASRAVEAIRAARPGGFEALLRDPTSQLDKDGAVFRQITAGVVHPPATVGGRSVVVHPNGIVWESRP